MGSELQCGYATPCAEGTLTDLIWSFACREVSEQMFIVIVIA